MQKAENSGLQPRINENKDDQSDELDQFCVLPRSANCGFVAGTLVQAVNGKVRIESLRVGDMVLSQLEIGGELVYKKVLKTFSFNNEEVYLLRFATVDLVDQLAVTGGQPFFVVGKGWKNASNLESGDLLLLADSSTASVFCVAPIFRTELESVGWVQGIHGVKANEWSGDIVDLRNSQIRFGDEGVQNIEIYSSEKPYLNRHIFNIEVEESQTFYVGELDVSVRQGSNNGTDKNSEFRMATTANRAMLKIDDPISPACCLLGTYVHTIYGWSEIQDIEVGLLVLSRCGKTGVQAYRPVIKCVAYEDKEVIDVQWRNERGNIEGVGATSRQLFWVIGIGWVPAGQLLPGHELEICNPRGSKNTESALTGERWRATVIGTKKDTHRNWPVYNLEVQEFQSYFVGYLGVWTSSSAIIDAKILPTK